ncbi:MAG: hypothetical protein QM692_00705 [Thermomicrobiales bacterium]
MDTSVVLPVLQGSIDLTKPEAPLGLHEQRAAQVIANLQHNRVRSFVTPTVVAEYLHAAIRGRYQHEIATTSTSEMVARFGTRTRSWTQLYKHDPTILRGMEPQFRNLRSVLRANGIGFIDPIDYPPPPNWRGFIPELLDLSLRYSLDTNDARILLEAQSLGIPHIVTLDRDMQRAAPDFTVYSWL